MSVMLMAKLSGKTICNPENGEFVVKLPSMKAVLLRKLLRNNLITGIQQGISIKAGLRLCLFFLNFN
jgi:hypothetical protein